MCAIFGAPDVTTFKKLYQENLCRGSAAFGMVSLSEQDGNTVVTKFKGVAELPETLPGKYFVGHTQAPTSAAQEYSERTSHPFTKGIWTVAHNGVLTNFNQLKEKVPSHTNIVDSSIIPALLDFYCMRLVSGSAEEFIIKILEMLHGTHTTWMCDRQDNRIWIARCGSTLFANLSERTFSSIKQPGMVELNDGGLYEICRDAIKQVGTFKAQSPFFII